MPVVSRGTAMRPRITIAALVAFVAFCGVGLAALRNPHEIWASALFTTALALVLTATLGARRNRAWLGYATFGWAYLALAFGPWIDGRTGIPRLLPGTLAIFAMDHIHGGMSPYSAVDENGVLMTYYPGLVAAPEWRVLPYQQAAHCLGAVAFGLIGAVVATLTAKRGEAP